MNSSDTATSDNGILYHGKPKLVSRSSVTQSLTSIGGNTQVNESSSGKVHVPLDFSIVLGWESIVKPLLSPTLDVDLTRLVHLTNSFESVDGPLVEGDIVNSTSQVTSIIDDNSGKTIEVECEISRSNKTIVIITSRFFIRGKSEQKNRIFF